MPPDEENCNGAHQNLKVIPQRVSLLTFKAFMTPCACTQGEDQVHCDTGIMAKHCQQDHFDTCAMCIRPDGSKPS